MILSPRVYFVYSSRQSADDHLGHSAHHHLRPAALEGKNLAGPPCPCVTTPKALTRYLSTESLVDPHRGADQRHPAGLPGSIPRATLRPPSDLHHPDREQPSGQLDGADRSEPGPRHTETHTHTSLFQMGASIPQVHRRANTVNTRSCRYDVPFDCVCGLWQETGTV